MQSKSWAPCPSAVWDLLAAVLVLVGFLAALLCTPPDGVMGHSQRILYVHVAVAWLALAAFVVMAAAGGMYLWRRDLNWDHWLHSAAELGWLAATLTLLTGSLWAHAAWNTWWTWDPRLLSSFVLWAMYSGLLMVRDGLDDPRRRARLAAVLAIVGLLDVPLVFLATRWFRGIHPVSPQMEPSMRLALLLMAAGFTALFAVLLVRRHGQLHLSGLLAGREEHPDS